MTQPTLFGPEVFRKFHDEGYWTSELLVDIFDRTVRARPSKVAIVEAHRVWSYAEVFDASTSLAASLARAGVAQGDVVAAQLPNWAELPIIHLATDRIGAIFLPLSPAFGPAETAHLVRASKAKVLFHSAEDLERAGAREQAGTCVPVRGQAGASGFESMVSDPRWKDGEERQSLANLRGNADAPSHVMVSSGSTGMPRCSLFSDNNTSFKLLQQWAAAAEATHADVAGALAPAGTGSTGYNYPILAMLLLGGTSVLLEHWHGNRVEAALDLMRKNACTIAVVVPAQMVKLVELARKSADVPRLRVITNAGAKLQPETASAAEELFGCKVQSIYGSSEAGACSMTSIRDSDDKRRSTVGRPVQGQEVRIFRSDGSVAEVGETGEVCWRGANKSYGFLHDPESTTRVWDQEGWMHSGDLGFIDPDGYIHVSGRIKDMIIRGGQNINPALIEEVIAAHPSVREVAVVGFADAQMGERVAACVVTNDRDLQLQALCSLVRARGLAAWNQPERLVVLPELPRNAGGKIDKLRLKETMRDADRNTSG